MYRNTDSGAPSLTGATGELVKVLRACLVDGYGSKPPAGWSMPYTDGQNPPLRAIFRQAPRDGWPRCDIQVDDHANGNTQGVNHIKVVGWETAGGIDSGFGRFPPGTAYCRAAKSTDTSTIRPWVCVATARSFLFIVPDPGNVEWYGATHYAWFFGDIIPTSHLDTWAVALVARPEPDPSDHPWNRHDLIDVANNPVMPNGPCAVRSYDGTPGPAALDVRPPFTLVGNSATQAGSGLLAYPNAADGKAYLSRRHITQGSAFRGWLPGIWYPDHNWRAHAGVAHGDTFDGSGALSGRSFLVVKRSGVFAFAVEVSDTWYI